MTTGQNILLPSSKNQNQNFPAQMMEILESKYENPSECISIWLKEVEKCGFQSFAYDGSGSDPTDAIANDNTKINVTDDNDEDGFVVADTFCKINESDVGKGNKNVLGQFF